MAFSVSEKAYLLFYLGYSGFEDDGPAQRAINSLDSQEIRMGPIIRDHLEKLQVIDKEIFETIPLASAIEDGSIKVRAHYTLNHLCKVARQYVTRLSRWTKIQIGDDVFAPGGPRVGFYSGDPSEHRVDGTSGVPQIDT